MSAAAPHTESAASPPLPAHTRTYIQPDRQQGRQALMLRVRCVSVDADGEKQVAAKE
jgi:hypothetical protein